MSKSQAKQAETMEAPYPEVGNSPLHGFQGNRGNTPATVAVPAALTIAVSREAGSRGNTIAKRVGKKLGWQVYNQEMLDYIAQEEASRADVINQLPPAHASWVKDHLDRLRREKDLGSEPNLLDVARIILALGAQGQAVLVGRGAGAILPREATLNVRIVAPLGDRITYMSQWLRLTLEQAADQVRLRDSRRGDLMTKHFRQSPADLYQYDLILNSSLLGEDLCVDLIVQAARVKQMSFTPEIPA